MLIIRGDASEMLVCVTDYSGDKRFSNTPPGSSSFVVIHISVSLQFIVIDQICAV